MGLLNKVILNLGYVSKDRYDELHENLAGSVALAESLGKNYSEMFKHAVSQNKEIENLAVILNSNNKTMLELQNQVGDLKLKLLKRKKKK